jgi:acyl transferase domain-containing protein/acyl carrier protein/SAM-dependent methyltransferase
MANVEYTGLEIAVIGLSGRFPGANSMRALWELLKAGGEGLSFFTDEELKQAGVDEKMLQHPDYVRSRGVVDKVEYFDNTFFGFSAKESMLLDPQVRLFLECTYEVLEDAGYNPFTYQKKIGLFAGANPNLYWSLGTYLTGIEDMGDFANKDLLSTRISYKLNLKGPSHTLFTACSTSLVAIHHACRSLLGGECDMALAGGVSIQLPQINGYIHQEGMILSTDGHNRSFDENASGAVFSNGAGIVMLKPLEDALNDGDHIYAVIKGSAVNNDGNRKVGFPAPSVKGQAEVIREALQVAQVDPSTVSYVEAHGSATAIGDPIEVEALTQAFNLNKKKSCGIGSIKSNLGHTNIASGVAGFIKAVLSLHHRTLPPSIHYNKPNPKIDFDATPFYVVHELAKWNAAPLRAGVSSFGVGGTNAHVVLEEAPAQVKQKDNDRPVLFLLSGHNAASLKGNRQALANFLENNQVSIRDAAYTLQVGRNAFAHRAMAVDDLRDAISNTIDENIENKIVFMFSGQGSQYVNMAKQLYENIPSFKDDVDKGFKIAGKQLDVRKVWLGDEDADLINHTAYTQPLLFIFEYALCRFIMKLGIKPDTMIGHSLGEYTAACIAGVFSFEDALKLVITRGRLMQSLPPGNMMVISITEEALLPLLPGSIAIAGINSNRSCVVSGKPGDVKQFKIDMEAAGYECRILRISHASHSPMMEPVLDEFREAFDGVKMEEPTIPLVSNRTGRFASSKEIKTAEYWTAHLRNAVRFYDGIKELSAFSNCIFIELGPGNTLSTLANQALAERNDCSVVNLMRHPKEEALDEHYLLRKLGSLWLKGVNINWQDYYENEIRRRVSLPTYSFDRKPFWFDEENFRKKTALLKSDAIAQVSSKIYKPTWISKPLQVTGTASDAQYVLFPDEDGIGEVLLREMKDLQVLTVNSGQPYLEVKNKIYCSASEIKLITDAGSKTIRFEDRKLLKRAAAELLDSSDKHVWLKGNDRLVYREDIPVAIAKPAQPILQHKNIAVAGNVDEDTLEYLLSRNNKLYLVKPEPAAPRKINTPEETRLDAAAGQFMKMLQQFSTALICSYFNECGVILEPGKIYTDDAIQGKLRMLPAFNKFYQYFLYVLSEDGIIEQANGQIKVLAAIDAAGTIANMQKHIEQNYPSSVSLYNLITHCVSNYRKALRGEIPAISVLFPEGSSKLLDSVSKDSAVFPGTSAYTQKAKELVLEYISQQPAGKKVRILEVGAGRGELTKIIAPALNGANVEYFFTDIGKTFINDAKRNFKPGYDFMKFAQFDIYADPAAQGFEQYSFDIVLALDVVHATPSLKKSIDNLQRMAVPGGWMLFIENTSTLRLVNLVWGLADGWWNFEDDANRKITPLMPVEAWRSLLLSMDFSFADTFQEQDVFNDHTLIMMQTKVQPAQDGIELIIQKPGIHLHELLSPEIEHCILFSPMDASLLEIPWQYIRLTHLLHPGRRVSKQAYFDLLDQCFSLYDTGELIVDSISPVQTENISVAVTEEQPDMSETELRLCQIWNEVFGITHTKPSDNYFELGGDSLMMVAVLSKIERAIGVKIKINEFHNNVTVASLAKLIDSRQQDTQLIITKAPVKEFYPCTSAQKTMFYLQLLHPENTAYNITKVIELFPGTDEEKIVACINKIISKQETLRTIFNIVNGEPSQKILDQFELKAEYFEGSVIPAVEVFIRPFDLTQTPGIRVGFIRGEDSLHMILDIHHIVCDGIAIDVLKKELANTYYGADATELPLQYKDFSEWQSTGSFKEYLATQKAFWLEKFKTPAPKLALPADFVRNKFDTPKGDHFVETLDRQLSLRIRKLVKSTNSTLFSHLLTATYVVLAKYSGVEDIVIGTGTSGRNFQNLDYIIGNFVNTVALRSFPLGDKSYASFQEEVKQAISQALENQDYQYDELINQLPYNQGKDDKDLFSVAVTLVTDSLVDQEDDPSKKLFKGYVEYLDKTSKFDLDINAVEKGDDITIVIEYSSLLYKQGTIKAFYKNYIQVLEQVASHPTTSIKDIEIQLPQKSSIKPLKSMLLKEQFFNQKY